MFGSGYYSITLLNTINTVKQYAPNIASHGKAHSADVHIKII